MTNTIAQLWNGNLEPVRNFGKNNSEIKQLQNLMRRNLDKLENSLNEEQKNQFANYCGCVEEYAILVSEQAFCDGFCLGTKIIVEALSGAEDIT